MRLCELKEKEVVNAKDCCRLGFVEDLDIDCKTGCVLALIVPGPVRFCIFGYDFEYVIPWKCICRSGRISSLWMWIRKRRSISFR